MKPGWDEWLAVALRRGLKPAEFWALSVREWRAFNRGAEGDEGMARARFEALSLAWPDEEKVGG